MVAFQEGPIGRSYRGHYRNPPGDGIGKIARGVAPQYGLYTAAIAGFVIALTGGSRFSVSGPTAAFVVILYPITQQYGLGGLVGGLGMVPGANIGKDCAIFEAVHGSAPDIVGKNIANPSSMILAAVKMLQYLGMLKEADTVLTALRDTIKSGDRTTRDLGGSHGTTEFTQAVLSRM